MNTQIYATNIDTSKGKEGGITLNYPILGKQKTTQHQRSYESLYESSSYLGCSWAHVSKGGSGGHEGEDKNCSSLLRDSEKMFW